MPHTDPLVLLPGLMNNARVWAWVNAHFTEVEHIEPELPALEDVDAIAHALLPTLPQRFAVAGFSFGGYVALALAALAPERVTRLALVSTNASADSTEQRAMREVLIDRALAGQYAGIGRRLTKISQHPSTHGDQRILDLRDEMALDYGAEKFVAHSRAVMTRADRHALLGALRIPVLLVVGDADQVTPVAGSEAMLRAQPAARLVVVPDAGHMVVLEKPAEIARALSEWLAA